MTYNKTTWSNGDVITAAKMNAIEDGIYLNSNIIKGKNILYNGKPFETVADWDGNTGTVSHWTRVMSSSKGDNIQFDSSAGEYLHVKFDAKVSSAKPGLVQFEKVYKQSSAVFHDGDYGGEIKDILGGQDVVFSLEVKTTHPVYVHKQLLVQFNDSTPNLSVLDPGTSEADPPVVTSSDGWKKLTVEATMPDNWQTILAGNNVKSAMLMINVYLRDNVTEAISDVEYWIRNVKLEYGTEETDFTYSDWDTEQILTGLLTAE